MSDHEDDEVALTFLEEVEHGFRRMIRGIFHFIFVRLPQWFYDLFINFFQWIERVFRFLVKLTVRLARTSFFAGIWMLLVIGPFTCSLLMNSRVPGQYVENHAGSGLAFDVSRWSWWQGITASWAGLALAGSIWGLYRLRRRRVARRATLRSPRRSKEVLPPLPPSKTPDATLLDDNFEPIKALPGDPGDALQQSHEDSDGSTPPLALKHPDTGVAQKRSVIDLILMGLLALFVSLLIIRLGSH